MSFTNGNDNFNVPLGETPNVDALGGNDLLVMDWSSLTGPIRYEAGFWQSFTDDMFNSVSFRNFERFDLTGGSGEDALQGGDDLLGDQLRGGAGDDTLSSGLGGDLLDGGAGTDVWSVNLESLGATGHVLTLLAGGATFTVDSTGQQLRNLEALSVITGGSHDIINTLAVVGNTWAQLRGGDDLARMGLGQHNLNGEGGTDTLEVNLASLGENIDTWYHSGGWYRFGEGAEGLNLTEFYSFERFNLTGGSGDDRLGHGDLGGGNDTLIGNAGHDTLIGGGGFGVDVISGGTGTDTWHADLSSYVGVTVNIAAEAGSVSTGHTVTGIEQAVLRFGAGDDSFTARAIAFNDDVSMGGGNDVVAIGRGFDRVHGGDGDDLLVMNWALERAAILQNYEGGGWYSFRTATGTARVDFYSIERFDLRGGTLGDDLHGGGLYDSLRGYAGDDTLRSGAGDALIDGGVGTDLWTADLSAENAPVVISLAGSQTAVQGTAAGLYIRNIERIELTTGAGNDVLDASGYALDDSAWTGGGDDHFVSGLGQDRFDGGAQGPNGDLLVSDYSSLTSRVSNVYESGGWSRLASANGAHSVAYTNVERFQLTGGSHHDSLSGGELGDTLVGNAGNDTLNGGGGVDSIVGGAGNDTWQGNHGGAAANLTLVLDANGDGTLSGIGTRLEGIENVTLVTGAGNDVVDTRAVANGRESLTLGGGDDVARVGTGQASVDMGTGGNDLLVADFSSSLGSVRFGYLGGGWYRAADGVRGGNRVDFYGAEVVEFTGGAADDRLQGFGAGDVLRGGAGNDLLVGFEGDDVLTGGAGADMFRVWVGSGLDTVTDAQAGDAIRVDGLAASGAVEVVGDFGASVGNNQVRMQVQQGDTFLYIGRDATAGADVTVRLQGVYEASAFTLAGRDIRITAGTTTPGGPDNDTLTGTAGNDSLSGGLGNDSLSGLAGADTLDGGEGTDRLSGGLGADLLTGGAGNDVFLYTSVSESGPGSAFRDVITDFTRGADLVDLSAIDANPVLAGDQAFVWRGALAFTGAAGQLRFDALNDLVAADINGDGIADLQIQIMGLTTLASTDFLL